MKFNSKLFRKDARHKFLFVVRLDIGFSKNDLLRSKISFRWREFIGQNFEKKFAKNRRARGIKRSLSLRYKCGVIDQVLRKPYTCIEHDLSDISRQVSLISDVERPTKYVLDCISYEL